MFLFTFTNNFGRLYGYIGDLSIDISVANASSAVAGLTIDKSVEFSYEELSKATNDFSMANKIGQGGFGSVYYAVLRGEVCWIRFFLLWFLGKLCKLTSDIVKMPSRNLKMPSRYCKNAIRYCKNWLFGTPKPSNCKNVIPKFEIVKMPLQTSLICNFATPNN